MGFEAGALAGGIVGGLIQNYQQKKEAGKSRDFQERMSSTSHQREVADLKAAGLNPVLSANSGASTPQGAQAQMENAIGPGISNALQARAIRNQIDETESRIQLNEATRTAQLAGANRDNTSAKQAAAQTLALEKQMPSIIERSRAEAASAKFRADNAKYFNTNEFIQSGLGTANSAKDLINIFKQQNQIPGKTKGGDFYNPSTGEVLAPWRK